MKINKKLKKSYRISYARKTSFPVTIYRDEVFSGKIWKNEVGLHMYDHKFALLNFRMKN